MKTKIATKKLGHYLLMAATILAYSACNDDDDEPNNPVSEQDKNFALNATYSNLAEIEMGQLAVSEATEESVQDFDEMRMIAHSNA